MEIAETILEIVRWWGLAGLVTAVAFLAVGIDRIDEDARGAYVFRPLLIPGILILWPLVLWRWWVLETGRDAWPLRHRPPRRAHLWAALTMAVLIPLIYLTALGIKQSWPDHITPIKIEPTETSG
ncbi:MAG: hypothetical protein AAFR17_07685 [Pseudomonadota bacterium]